MRFTKLSLNAFRETTPLDSYPPPLLFYVYFYIKITTSL